MGWKEDASNFDPLRAVKADAWDEACQAFAWCRANGNDPIEDPLHYVIASNPYRTPIEGSEPTA